MSEDSAIRGLAIRPADEADVPVILRFIRELAEYERLRHEAVATEDDLRRHLFGERPTAEVILAEVEGEPVGFALFFTSFSTFLGRPGLYLEDLFVRPEWRGRGIGRRLLGHLAPHPRPRVRAAGVVGARLERARDWVLPRPRRAGHGRVDDLSAYGGSAGAEGQ